jgi:hypothetical protein
MFKGFLNLPMGRLCTVEALPHYQASITFQSASSGNVSMIMNTEDLDSYIKLLQKARADMPIADDLHEDEIEDEAVEA